MRPVHTPGSRSGSVSHAPAPAGTAAQASPYAFFSLLVCAFLLFLGYFVYNGAWYAPAEVIIKGKVEHLPASFDVSWDSGHGYNRYERYPVALLLKLPAEKSRHRLQVSWLGEKNSASLSKDVFCKQIIADGRLLAENVLLNEQQPMVELAVEAQQSITVEVATNTSSGQVRIAVNDHIVEKDLYIANVEAKSRTFTFWLVTRQNEFTVNAPLPRYPIHTLTLKAKEAGTIALSSVAVQSEDRSANLLSQPLAPLDQHSFTGVQRVQKRLFSWRQFGLQIVFALLSTWLFSGLWRLVRTCGGLGGILAKKRRFFWRLLVGAFSCYLLWLLIFWPGILSVDSLKVWRAAQLPEVYLNDHPILNVLLYSYLYHIYNNPAVVALFQAGMMAILVAWIFSAIHGRGVPLKLLIPFYLLTIFSIPIGLYNTVLWKDIPFALLIVFWAFTAVQLFHASSSHSLALSKERILALFLLLLSLALIRHNGIVYLLFIPLLFLLLGLLRPGRAGWLFLGMFTVVGSLLLVVLGSGMVADSGYLFEQGRIYLSNMLGTSPGDLLARTWRNYWGVLDINQTVSKWDLWHFYLQDRFSYGFLHHAGWNDIYPYLPQNTGLLAGLKEPAMALYWASYKSPWVYLTWNPVWVLALLPCCLLLFRWLPLSAIFSAVVLVQIITLVLLDVFNWRYYYFACLAGYFLVPVILLDLYRRKAAAPCRHG